jgi:K+-sensing histidine kinase KdpD
VTNASIQTLAHILLATLAVAVLTATMFLIGRDRLGEGVIALVYLIPISWSTTRWGQEAGIAAAITAALGFNYFFIPPFYTLYIGSLEGWLLLGIFIEVAIPVVGRIQSGLSQAREHERQAVFLYELSTALAGTLSPRTMAGILADKTRQQFLAGVVQVHIDWNGGSFAVTSPAGARPAGKPDLVVPILTARRLEGEIRLWRGKFLAVEADDRLLQNFANQGAMALERARLMGRPVQPEAG